MRDFGIWAVGKAVYDYFREFGLFREQYIFSKFKQSTLSNLVTFSISAIVSQKETKIVFQNVKSVNICISNSEKNI